MKKLFYFFILLIASCTIAPRINVATVGNSIPMRGEKLFSVLYQQRAAEYRALCFQAFNIAHERVDEISLPKTGKPKVIITDIDETILNNSPYQAHQLLQGKDYEPSSWHEWTAMAEADTVPGALSFLKYASSKGIEIFYVTNRNENERNVTLKNLQKFNFPNAEDSNLFLLTNTSSKETRRQTIASSHDIIMLMGDNLGDFSFLFDHKSYDERVYNVNAAAEEFGHKFIVLPNAVYGDWEAALYNYKPLTAVQKDSVLQSSLLSY